MTVSYYIYGIKCVQRRMEPCARTWCFGAELLLYITYNCEGDEEAEDGKAAHLALVPTSVSLLHVPAHAQ